MFIQGDLQAVFDALYEIGAIDPVLKMDWNAVSAEMQKYPKILENAFSVVNKCAGDRDQLLNELHQMDNQALTYIALEVAREFAEFQDRKDLH